MSRNDPMRDGFGSLEPARPAVRPDRRRRLSGAAERQDEPALTLEDVERGRSAALLGALGRLQLRVDVLAKQQEQVLERLVTAVEALEARIARLDARTPDAAPAERPAQPTTAPASSATAGAGDSPSA